MKKSIFLFFAAILCAMTANAAPEKLYLTPNSNWNVDGARFAAYFFGNGETWLSMTKVAGETNLYEVTTPAGYTSVIFCRMNPNAADNKWDNKWNQTGDLAIPTDGTNKYTVKDGTWDNGGGDWSTYTPASTEEPETPAEPVIPAYYIAGNGNFVGADKEWNEKNDALKMTYNETNKNYTFTVTNVAADKECQFKVTSGTWNPTWGGADVSPAIEGVTTSNDGNVVFTLSTGGDVTVIFDGTNIQLTTTGEIKVAIPEPSEPELVNVYLKPNTNWTTDNPRYAVYLMGGSADRTWQDLTVAEGETDIYTVELDKTTFTGLIFCRMNPDAADNNWDNRWNQTGNLTLPADGKNLFTVKAGTWDGATETWSVYTKTPATPDPTPDPDPVADVTVYFVNTKSWATVNAYVWGSSEYKAWPGEAMTLTGDKAHGYDVYSYTFPAEYTNCIFNGNGQTDDLTVNAGQYYDIASETWYATLAEVPYVEPTSLTYTVKVPAGTPECYITGENTGGFGKFVKMNPAAEADVFTVDIAWATESQKYKYSASASWDYEEVKANGDAVDDRTWQAEDEVAKWKTDPTATATPVDAYTVTVPDGTIECYICGAWDWSKFEKMELVAGETNKYTISIPTATSIHQYKYTCGPDWKYAEVGGNRTWDDVDDVVTEWEEIYDPNYVADLSNQPATLYFRPSTSWKSDNARFAAYFFGTEEKWADMTDSNSDGIYEVANDKTNANVIFCRMNPDAADNKWENKWNQTGDLEIPNTAGDLNTCYTFWKNNIDDASGIWVVPTSLTDANWSTFVSTYNGQTINAVVERSFNAGQNHTLCLPFDLPTNWLGFTNDDAKAYQLSSVVANSATELSLTVTSCATILAGQPYIVVPAKNAEYENLVVSGVTVKNVTAGTNAVTGGGVKATLKAVTATNGTTNGSTEYYVGANDGCLYNAVVDKLGLRAVIELTTTGGQPLPAKVRAYVATGENEATGFENIVAPEGQTIKAIVNGQLVIIRGGEMYNVQGQRL